MQTVFVFGTLKPGERFDYILSGALANENIPARYRKATTTGTLYGLRDGYPAMAIGPGHLGDVHGYVVDINDNPTVIANLYMLEGYNPGHDERSLYIPNMIEVTLEDGTLINTMTFIYNNTFLANALVEEQENRRNPVSAYDAKHPFKISEFLSGNWTGEENDIRFKRAFRKETERKAALAFNSEETEKVKSEV